VGIPLVKVSLSGLFKGGGSLQKVQVETSKKNEEDDHDEIREDGNDSDGNNDENELEKSDSLDDERQNVDNWFVERGLFLFSVNFLFFIFINPCLASLNYLWTNTGSLAYDRDISTISRFVT